MSTFLRTLALFLLPLFLFFTPPFVVLLFAGELYPDTVIEQLSEERPIVVRDAFSNYVEEFKHDETVLRKPSVLALGNSRVGEFRAAFLKDPTLFYNATGGVTALSDFRYFIDGSPGTSPQVVIANMDQPFFNPRSARDGLIERPNPYAVHSPPYDIVFESMFRNGGWWKVYAYYLTGKFTLADIFALRSENTAFIGLTAHVTGAGYLNDGSDFYGDVIAHAAAQQQVQASIASIAAGISGTNGDLYGDAVSTDALIEVRRFLDACEARHIFCIGFLPPVAHQEYARLKAFPQATYAHSFTDLGPSLATIYREYGFDFYDFSDISSFGSSDAEMVEARHGGEKMYLRLFIRMAQGSKPLAAFADIPHLAERLASTTNPYLVFGRCGRSCP